MTNLCSKKWNKKKQKTIEWSSKIRWLFFFVAVLDSVSSVEGSRARRSKNRKRKGASQANSSAAENNNSETVEGKFLVDSSYNSCSGSPVCLR